MHIKGILVRANNLFRLILNSGKDKGTALGRQSLALVIFTS